jgi:arsenate reductase
VIPPLARRLLAEFLGTGLLVAVVVGSGIAAQRLSPDDTGLQLLQNSLTTVFGLGVLILVLGPVSGAHFNPVVSLVDWWLGRRDRSGARPRRAGRLRRRAGRRRRPGRGARERHVRPARRADRDHGTGVVGLWVARWWRRPAWCLTILALSRTGRRRLSAAAVASWIGAAYWFTSSTSFANPAVTAGRMFSDTFAGIAPVSVPAFVLAQLVGAAVGVGLAVVLLPTGVDADRVVVERGST